MAGSNAWQQEDGKSVTSFIWNDSPYAISQGFGENSPSVPDSWYAYSADYGLNEGDHAGIDIAMPRGTPISAPEEGDILQSGDSPYFRPDPVWLKTSDGRVIILGHLWSDTVKAGDHVAKGQLVGYSGEQTIAGTRTPDGSGPHLHLEERQQIGRAHV